jgi:hypothetical protein
VIARARIRAQGPPATTCAHRLAFTALSAFTLAGCLFDKPSDDPNAWYNKTMQEHLTGRPSEGSPAATGTVGPSARALVADSELYSSDASCGGIALGSGRPASTAAASDIALDMTECEVARRVGAPDKIDLATGEKGERLLLLTYARGERPRVYRFAAGRLTGIEALTPAPSGRRLAKPASSPPPHD